MGVAKLQGLCQCHNVTGTTLASLTICHYCTPYASANPLNPGGLISCQANGTTLASDSLAPAIFVP